MRKDPGEHMSGLRPMQMLQFFLSHSVPANAKCISMHTGPNSGLSDDVAAFERNRQRPFL